MSTTSPANSLRREDYKAIKHMDKAELTAYLARIYRRGYEAGLKTAQAAPPGAPATPTIESE